MSDYRYISVELRTLATHDRRRVRKSRWAQKKFYEDAFIASVNVTCWNQQQEPVRVSSRGPTLFPENPGKVEPPPPSAVPHHEELEIQPEEFVRSVKWGLRDNTALGPDNKRVYALATGALIQRRQKGPGKEGPLSGRGNGTGGSDDKVVVEEQTLGRGATTNFPQNPTQPRMTEKGEIVGSHGLRATPHPPHRRRRPLAANKVVQFLLLPPISEKRVESNEEPVPEQVGTFASGPPYKEAAWKGRGRLSRQTSCNDPRLRLS
ncbi:hypothetical protein KM043_008066 [Ampulex compressa]|nr:hypothetical protein KM043_008066 [Ampulex compressa]